MNLSPKKVKPLVILLLTLTSTVTTLSLLPRVSAEVKIISINPLSGYVGTNVTLTANITTVNGQYQILFDEATLQSGNAIENNVTVSITIPPATVGNHTVKIFDISSGENATTTFEVLTEYLLTISPLELPTQQRQEGDSAEILLNITGGEPNKLYVANVTVQNPKASHVKLLDIITSELGSGNGIIKYPENFENANTSYVGEYTLSFNETLATARFTIGLTNATEYHRFQIVDIKAVSYSPEENVTITITGENVYHSENLIADSEGIIHYTSWSVPSNASIGTYTVNITSTLNMTIKNPPDIQTFTVSGFDVNITARNLAKEPVSDVTIRIFENGVSVKNVTSGSDGLASVKLEIGNYTSEAYEPYFKEKKVGESWINVTEAASFDIFCNLTNLKVSVLTVVYGNEIYVPEVGIYLSPKNLTLIPTLTTNITGIAVFHSLLSNVNYTLSASRYGMQFNTTELQGLLQDESTVAWFNLTIMCPIYTLQVNVTNPNAGDQPISNAAVKIHEFLGGLYFERSTAVDGVAVFNCPFGKYKVEVYVDGIKLNETTVNLNESIINVLLSCKFYGLNVSVSVIDYFGQPIPNANVTLLRNGLRYSALTKPDGAAEFLDIIGGELQAIVYLPGQSQPYMVKAFYVDNSTKTIQFKAERYVMLVGFLVETGQLATTIMIVVSVILVFLFEFYRRKRSKPKASGSES